MSPAPEIRPRILGAEGSLAGDLQEGRGRAASLFPEEALAAAEPVERTGGGRIGPGAFGTTTPGARERLERVLGGEGVLVSTGQQPVLFLGPLYLLYKVLGAIQLAAEVEEATGRPALASFWIASDDHDWEEVGGTRVLDRENRLREIRLRPPRGRADRSVGPTPLPDRIEQKMSEVFHLLPESEFIDEYLKLFQEAYRPGRSVARAFGRALEGIVGERPLAWLDAAAAEVKSAAVPLFRRALEDARGGEEALRRGAERTREAGYGVQVPLMEGGTHLFYDTGEARVRLYRGGDGSLRLGREGRRVEGSAVLEELESDPTRFSPNVALRPVLEAWLLPVGYAVGGPGELAYWAQLAPLFERRGVALPRVRPRPSWVVVEDKVKKVLDKVDVGPEAFADGGEALIREAVSAARPESVDAALGELRAAIQGATVRMEEALEEELPGIRPSVGKARGRLFAAVDELEDAVDGRVEERQEVVVRQIRKAAAHFYPDGSPQERVLNPLYYLSRYGRDFLAAVEEAGRQRPIRPRPGTEA